MLSAQSPRIAPDPKHSTDEDLMIAVGRTSAVPCRPGLCTLRRLQPMKKKVPQKELW